MNMVTLESWVEESIRRGEQMVVILRNKSTGEEIETTINPKFIASIQCVGYLERRG